MKTKWILGIVIITLIASIAFFVYNNHKGQTDDDVFRIGVILPLTGDWASFGKQMVNGIQLWEKGHSNANIEVIFEDGKGLATDSINALNRDLWQHNIHTYISGFSAAILGMAPIIVKNNAFLINAGATNPKIKEFGENIFTLIPDADVEAKFLANFVSDSLKEKQCFIYYQNDDSGKGLADVFGDTYEELGGVVSGREAIQSDSEIANVLQKIRLTNSKVVFIPANGAYVAKIIRQAQKLDMKNIVWIGYAGTETPEIVQLLAGMDSVKLIFSTYSYSDSSIHDDRTKAFIDDYTKTYGDIPAYYAATCYDAIDLVFLAYQTCEKEADIAKVIQDMDSYHGVSGAYEIKGKNHVSSGMSLKMFSHGAIVPYDETLLGRN